MKELFGTDGFRGIANEDLNTLNAMKMGMAISTYFKDMDKPILIARDTRISGETLELALTAGMNSAGKDVLSCGILPTPALAILTMLRNTIGVVISASHNPPEYNGIKVLKNGYKLSDEEEESIENLYFSEKFSLSKWSFGKRMISDELKYEYFDYIKRMILNDGKNIKGMKLSVDLAYGATISTISEFLESVGADVEKFNTELNGMKINVNCGSTHPEFLIERMDKNRIGGTFDGDGDRCIMAVDGKILDGDLIILLNALKMKKEGKLKKNTVILTVMSNLGIEMKLNEYGVNVVRTKVGDRYILSKMLKDEYNLGGEQSGHIIFLDQAPTGDGLITFLNTILIYKYQPSLFNIMDEIKLFPQYKKSIEVSDKVKIANKIKENDIYKKILKDLGSNGRIVLRPSGTENVVRIMVEHENEEKGKDILNEIASLVEKIEQSENR